jgi:hypothetical protein
MPNRSQGMNLGLLLDRPQTNREDPRMRPVRQCNNIRLELIQSFNQRMQGFLSKCFVFS